MTKNHQLGRLEKLDLREVWTSESGDFTPWLAQGHNLKLLGDSIGLDLQCDSQEKRVGPFRADILCKDNATESWVLIENQLERTDHGHLGQLLTYAAGLEAVTIVWVAERFTEEHRAALDWLNEHTDEKINLFGLEVELWRIGNSEPAPKFNVVCKPNEWARHVADSARTLGHGELSTLRQLQFEYWNEFLECLRQRKRLKENRTAQPSSWMGFPIGRSGFRLWTEMYLREDAIGVGLSVRPPHAQHYFDQLVSKKTEIEREFGAELDWDLKDGREAVYVAVYKDGVDPKDKSTWAAQHTWLAENLERFHTVFSEYVRRLSAPTSED